VDLKHADRVNGRGKEAYFFAYNLFLLNIKCNPEHIAL
jgi:hypothetical protein